MYFLLLKPNKIRLLISQKGNFMKRNRYLVSYFCFEKANLKENLLF